MQTLLPHLTHKYLFMWPRFNISAYDPRPTVLIPIICGLDCVANKYNAVEYHVSELHQDRSAQIQQVCQVYELNSVRSGD